MAFLKIHDPLARAKRQTPATPFHLRKARHIAWPNITPSRLKKHGRANCNSFVECGGQRRAPPFEKAKGYHNQSLSFRTPRHRRATPTQGMATHVTGCSCKHSSSLKGEGGGQEGRRGESWGHGNLVCPFKNLKTVWFSQHRAPKVQKFTKRDTWAHHHSRVVWGGLLLGTLVPR